jgi:hypothetical protein
VTLAAVRRHGKDLLFGQANAIITFNPDNVPLERLERFVSPTRAVHESHAAA